MIEPATHAELKRTIGQRIGEDKALLDQLREEVRPLRAAVRRILPRTTTAISLVGTDGGNNSIPFDPFLIHLIRVVDSSNNEYCLEAITPSTGVDALCRDQYGPDGATPRTALGDLMRFLGVHR